jgi:hypothetical protein
MDAAVLCQPPKPAIIRAASIPTVCEALGDAGPAPASLPGLMPFCLNVPPVIMEDIQASAAANANSGQTLAGAGIGTASALRLLVFRVYFEGNVTLSSLTVDGNATTAGPAIINTAANPDIGVQLRYLRLTTGTTANIAIAFSGSCTWWWGCTVLHNVLSATPYHAPAGVAANANSVSLNLNIPAGGFFMAPGISQTQGTGFSETGGVEALDIDIGSMRIGGIYGLPTASATGHALTLNQGISNQKAMAAASWR